MTEPPAVTPPRGATQLQWRPLAESDLAELMQLISVIEEADRPRERESYPGLVESFRIPGTVPQRDTLVGHDRDGALVAFGWNLAQHGDVTLRRVKLKGGVHPSWRRRGIGHALLAWQLDAARAWYAQTRTAEHGPLRMLTRVDDHLTGQRRLYDDLGLPTSRWFADLGQVFAGEPAAPEPVAGVDIVAMTPELVEGSRLAYNAAFLGEWNAQPMTVDRWSHLLGASTARPEWCLAAVPHGTTDVVGCVLNCTYEAEWPAQGYSQGEIDWLAVVPAWRKRGIASALVRRSMQLFWAAGLQAASIGVDSDNPTGAFGLYQELGFQVRGRFVIHSRDETGSGQLAVPGPSGSNR
jgi:mycothiol synthase